MSRFERPQIAWACLGAASLGAVALIGLEGRGTTFSGDEWAYLHRLAHESFASALFEAPPGQYLIAVPMLVYAALANVLGTDSYLPLRLAGLALIVLASGLLFELTRRRIGYLAALPGPIVLLVFGAAYEVVVIPMRLPSQIAICAGLGMLLALDRRDRRGDVLACLLGVVAVMSHPVSLAFVAAAGVRVVLEDWRFSLRRAWVALLPAGIFGLWMVTLRVPVEGAPPTELSHVTSFASDLFVAVTAALTGVFRAPWTSGVDFINFWSVAIAVAVVVVAALAVLAARRFSVGLAAATAGLAVAIVAPALTAWAVIRMPEAPRYLYPGAILLVLVAAEVAALHRPRPRARLVAAALVGLVFASALYSNVTFLREQASGYVEASAVLKAELGALDLARPDVPSGARPTGPGASDPENLVELIFAHGATGEVAARARAASAPVYYEIADAYGSPGFDASVLADLKPSLREHVDRVLVAVTETELRPAPPPSRVFAPDASTQRSGREGGCAKARGGRALRIRPGERVWVERQGRTPPEIRVGRFGINPIVALEWPPGARAAVLSFPSTGLEDLEWTVAVAPDDEARICT